MEYTFKKNHNIFLSMTACIAALGLAAIAFSAKAQDHLSKNSALPADNKSLSQHVELTVNTIPDSWLQTFVSKQVNVWNNTDTKDRLIKMDELYQRNVSFYDHDGTVNGLEKLNERITTLQKKFSGFKFSLIKIDASNNVLRYFWNFGPEANPTLISGMDLIILEKNKIRSLHVFLDHLPAAAQK